jgi:anti-sigma factor RsiW
MGDPHPELAHPEVAGWVLGTLDPDDAEWFAGHLPTCQGCRTAVAKFGPTARLLVTAVPADLPPPGLQARTLAGVARAATEARRAGQLRRPEVANQEPRG